MKNLD